MQIIELETEAAAFYCPVTGHRILGENYYKPSPAVRGIWVTEVEDQPEVYDAKFLQQWETYYEALCEAEDDTLDMREFFESQDKPNWVVFELHYRSIACGPVFSTQWLVIDMDAPEAH